MKRLDKVIEAGDVAEGIQVEEFVVAVGTCEQTGAEVLVLQISGTCGPSCASRHPTHRKSFALPAEFALKIGQGLVNQAKKSLGAAATEAPPAEGLVH